MPQPAPAVASVRLPPLGMSDRPAVNRRSFGIGLLGVVLIWTIMAYVVAHSGFPVATARIGPREWFLDSFRNEGAATGRYSVSDVSNQFHVQTIGGLFAVSAGVLHMLGIQYKVIQFLPTTQF